MCEQELIAQIRKTLVGGLTVSGQVERLKELIGQLESVDHDLVVIQSAYIHEHNPLVWQLMNPDKLISEQFAPISTKLLYLQQINCMLPSVGEEIFTKEEINTFIKQAPSWPQEEGDQHVDVVPVIYLGQPGDPESVVRTFKFWWDLVVYSHNGKHWVWDKIILDKDHLRLAEGTEHPGRCIRWEVIDRGANKGRSPYKVRAAVKNLPHASIFASHAYSPLSVSKMIRSKTPSNWLTGYDMKINDHWSWVPLVYFYQDFYGIRLRGRSVVRGDGLSSVPVFRES